MCVDVVRARVTDDVAAPESGGAEDFVSNPRSPKINVGTTTRRGGETADPVSCSVNIERGGVPEGVCQLVALFWPSTVSYRGRSSNLRFR